ncbi:uncharacterized protein E0L32_006508 [Thyridium curvatum]|uniref:Integrase catalytic domain-containing protein n=1 Tax=Thyridium curvatum TaxID=1093900 RepID=A0A507ASW1_9PEZI|nr:uncharacterized protein E0L32_006508 [Thyridium curvatum]TPX13082.1 hypothetical protein E0L32_006508 [Thyridium curvatum]
MAKEDLDNDQAVILTNEADWNTWYSHIRLKATDDEIWEYIDPDGDQTLEPPRDRPRPPPIPSTTLQGEQLATAHLEFRMRKDFFDMELEEWKVLNTAYEKKNKKLIEMNELIYRTAKRHVALFNESSEEQQRAITWIPDGTGVIRQPPRVGSARARLRALKERLKPSGFEARAQARARYQQARQPPRSTSLSAWIEQWEQALRYAKNVNISDVQGNQPAEDFLIAISGVNEVSSTFAQTYMNTLNQEGSIPDGYTLARQLQRQLAATATVKGSAKGSFNAAVEPAQRLTEQPTLQGKAPNGERPTCPCGMKHNENQCWVLHPEKKPVHMPPFSRRRLERVLRKITETDQLRKQYQNSIKAIEESLAKLPPADQRSGEARQIGSAYARTISVKKASQRVSSNVMASSFVATAYPLKDNFIHDTGTTCHIVNSKEKLIEGTYRPATGVINAGDTTIPYYGMGEAMMEVNTPTGLARFKLKNVVVAEGFHVNLVSHGAMREAGYRWNDDNCSITKGSVSGPVVFLTKQIEGHTVIDFHRSQGWANKQQSDEAANAASSRKPSPESKARYDTWHRRMGHLNDEALGHLSANTRGVVIAGKSDQPCQACVEAKAKQQVSRRPSGRPAEHPFGRIHLDLFAMPDCLDGSTVALIIKDEFSGLKVTYPLPDKKKYTLLETLHNYCSLVDRQWGLQVQRGRSDNEPALNADAIEEWKQHEGIVWEPSPIYTHQPNGHAERSGGVIRTKANAMLFDAGLPTDLASEAYKAATYLYNRSPRRANGWKSPEETIRQWCQENGHWIPGGLNQPDLSHIKEYGSKAHCLKDEYHNATISTKAKHQPRTEIGYLVGYEDTNIWRIWIPEKRKVVPLRDVTFEEGSFFKKENHDGSRERLATFTPPVEVYELPKLAEREPEPEETDDEITSLSGPTDGPFEAAGEGDQSQQAEAIEKAGPAQERLEEIIVAYPTPRQSEEPVQEPATTGPTEGSESTTPGPMTPETSSEGENSVPKVPVNFQEDSSSSAPIRRSARNRKATSRGQQSREQEELFRRRRRAVDGMIPENRHGVNAVHASFQAEVVPVEQEPQWPLRLHRKDLPPEPKTSKEAVNSEYGSHWLKAMRKEVKNVQDNGTLEIVDHHEAKGQMVIPLKWMFTYKFNSEGYVERFKARICVRGDQQPPNDRDTYAATLAGRSFRILMATAARFRLKVKQLDAINAFTNAYLDEEVFVELPPYFKQNGKIARLIRALYGLRISPLLWQKLLSEVLIDMGFTQSTEEPCLFYNDSVLVFFYVDDIVYLYREEDEAKGEAFKKDLTSRFEMRDLGDIKWFLGMRVVQSSDRSQIWISQEDKITNLAARHKLDDMVGGPATPMSVEEIMKPDEQATSSEIHIYQQKVGSLIYLSITTRPDIAKAVTSLARFLTNPPPKAMKEVDRVIRYLLRTKDLGILFDGNDPDPSLKVYTDASFGDDPETRKSSQGYLMKLFGSVVDWKAIKQNTVTTSSTEAELLALTSSLRETIATMRFFERMTLQLSGQFVVYCDNRQTIRLVKSENPRLKTALRHVDIHHHWARQEVQKKTVEIEYLATDQMPADGLTKILPINKHREFIKQLGLCICPITTFGGDQD